MYLSFSNDRTGWCFFFPFLAQRSKTGCCERLFEHVLVSVLACWQERVLCSGLRAGTFGGDLIMSYQYGWKGGQHNNLLSHGSPLRAWMFVRGLGSTMLMLRLLLSGLCRNRLKRNPSKYHSRHVLFLHMQFELFTYSECSLTKSSSSFLVRLKYLFVDKNIVIHFLYIQYSSKCFKWDC